MNEIKKTNNYTELAAFDFSQLQEENQGAEFSFDTYKFPTGGMTALRIRICTSCGETVESEILTATGHASDTWVVKAEPTCTEPGERFKICDHCGETFDTEIRTFFEGWHFNICAGMCIIARLPARSIKI